MDNTPVEEADQLDGTVRYSISSSIIFGHAMEVMYGSISRAASYCNKSRTRRHRFAGYPRESARCRSCGVPLFRMAA